MERDSAEYVHVDTHAPSKPGVRAFLKAVWTTGLCRLLFVTFVYTFGFAVIIPVIPTLQTNYFASRRAGYPIDCQDYSPADSPPACRAAHTDVVYWSSWSDFFSHTIITFLCAPLVGELSDKYGRRPFIIAAFCLALLPMTMLMLYLQGLVPLIWYYPCAVLSSLVSSTAVVIAAVADVMPKQHRTMGFGLILSAYSSGFMVGPLVGAFIAPLPAAITCLSCLSFCIVFSALFLKETAGPVAGLERSASIIRASGTQVKPWGFVANMKQLASNRLFQQLALCVLLTGIVSEGIADTLVQYLQLTVGFTTRDNGLLFFVLGLSGLLVQGVVVVVLAPLLGEQRLLVCGLLLTIIEYMLLSVVQHKWQALVAVSVGSMAGVAWPAISSLKANNVGQDQQGLVQGVLASIRSLSMGIGPLVFAKLFAVFTSEDGPFGYHPGAIFWVSSCFCALAAVVAATIHRDAGQGLKEAGASGGVTGGDAELSCSSSCSRTNSGWSSDDAERAVAPAGDADDQQPLLLRK